MLRESFGYENRWKALAFISISVLVLSLDNTILNVALPSIARQLGASAGDLQWMVDAYILVFAALLLTTGAMGDRIGRKKILQAGLALFGVGSWAASVAPSIIALIAARAFLGLGGAMILPATLSLIAATFREPGERSRAIAAWSAVFGLGLGLGPLVGGWLLEHFAWNSVFFVNLPVVVVALVGGQVFITESRDTHSRPLDVPGVMLSVLGLFALVYALIETGSAGWREPAVQVAFGGAVVLLALFGWWEKSNPNAMLPLSFFRNPSFSGANLALVLIFFANYGCVFFLSQYFQTVQGYGALQTGWLLLPTALLATLGSGLSARLTARFGVKVAVAGGIGAAAIGLVALARLADVTTPYLSLFPALALFSFGLGLAIPAATGSVMSSVPVNRVGIGSGMNDTTRQLGGALGVALLGAWMNRVYTGQIMAWGADVELSGLPGSGLAVISRSIQAAHAVAREVPSPRLAEAILNTSNQAFMAGMTTALLLAAVILAVASVLALVLLPSSVRRSTDTVETYAISPTRPAK